MKNKRAEESLSGNSEALEKKHALNRVYMKNKRVFSQLHNREPSNSNRNRICRENNIIPEHSVRQNNNLQKSSSSSGNTHGTVFNVSLPQNLRVSKHNETTINNFVKELSKYPEYTCIMCKMLFFNHQVSEITDDGKNNRMFANLCAKNTFSIMSILV